MAISVKHAFQSAKGDGSDATLVRPSNWNADHTINMATQKLLGRMTAGTGLAEEITCTTYMATLLAAVDNAALAAILGLPTTGDAKLTYKTTADIGWILANDGTIGDATSGATVVNSTNFPTLALFTHFYNTFSDAVCPLQTSTGVGTTRVSQGAAATAYGNHCRMVIPKTLGRALIIAGTGAGLSARGLAGIGGEESHQLSVAELPSHGHGFSSGTMTSGSMSGGVNCGSGSFSGGTGPTNTSATYTDHVHGFSVSGGIQNVAGGGQWLHSHPVTGATKGGTSTAAIQGGGTYFAPVYAVTADIGIGNVDLNHAHVISFTSNTDGAHPSYPNAASHSHPLNVSVGGSIQVDSITVGINAGSTVTGTVDANGSSLSHNIMQPWTAWNIMIRL